MRLILLVAAGGAVGSVARYGVGELAQRWFGSSFPWGTLAVNITGSFAMGLLLAWIMTRTQLSAELRALVATGFLGGFTTFSAFSWDVLQLIERKALGAALGYAGASVALSLAAVFVGAHLARVLWP